jgi:hypothetical protein
MGGLCAADVDLQADGGSWTASRGCESGEREGGRGCCKVDTECGLFGAGLAAEFNHCHGELIVYVLVLSRFFHKNVEMRTKA